MLGLNPLRILPSLGVAVWGARTRSGADGDFLYVPVKRMTVFLEQSIASGTQRAAFEPNGPALWANIQSAAADFMQRLFVQGAFVGAPPKDADFVRCDATTTRQADVDQGVLNILVGFAPTRPAEHVILRLQQCAGKP